MTDDVYPRIYGNSELLCSDPRLCAAFTGRRAAGARVEQASESTVESLMPILKRQSDEGYCVFFTGLATGFDLDAARAVLFLRDTEKKSISLVGVQPFTGQTAGWDRLWKREHDEVTRLLDCRVVLRGNYSKYAYFQRNRYMVDHSSLLIAQLDAKSGGTAQTIRLARAAGIPVVFADGFNE